MVMAALDTTKGENLQLSGLVSAQQHAGQIIKNHSELNHFVLYSNLRIGD